MINLSPSLFSHARHASADCQPRVARQPQGQNHEAFAGKTLNNALEKNLGVKATADVSKSFDVDAVVNAVMEHVNKALDKAAMKGASKDELNGMLDQARAGVSKGFTQAREALDKLGKLDDPLAEKIDSAESKINDGLDKLDKKLNQPETSSGGVLASAGQSYAKRNDFAFSVTTKEGDVVKISAMSLYKQKVEMQSYQDDEKSLFAANSSELSRNGYSFSVQGDINDDEMQALETLFSQVNDVAQTFYNGDLNTAFNKASELGFNGDQIASFSLDLRQTETISQYQQVAAVPDLPKGIKGPLQDYAKQLKDSVQTANAFQNPFALVRDMLDGMVQDPAIKNVNAPFAKLFA
ncbi:MAG: DUF5610 domain-containing protein [Oceanospirillaceae bacterium]|nr:DUF5610 domain-containing protein [Oceanospirillaceae bacterium]MCP5350556.1 DUF5610 domain-containing protein [Oceanospirillaceae bacterium]